MVSTWEVEFFNRSPDVQKKLALLYLANDVLQNSRKKGPQYVQEFYRALPKALKHVVKHGDGSVSFPQHNSATLTCSTEGCAACAFQEPILLSSSRGCS